MAVSSRIEGSSDEIDLVQYASGLPAIDTNEDAFVQPLKDGGSGLDLD
jgi:hypothetical protein